MKINGYKFGHPVFGNSDYYSFGPKCNIEEFIQNNHFKITSEEVNFGANEKLEEMLLNNDACLIAEVFCTHTMYREVFRQDFRFDISISLENLKNKVEAIFLVVANRDIPEYSNSSVIPEARELKFYIEKGEILAFLGEYHFELDLIGTSLDSIIKIKTAESNRTKEVFYEYSDDSILIILPEKQFKDLKMYAENPDYQKLLISSLLQTALIHACYKLCGENKEAYLEKQWARVLHIHWQNNGNDSDFPLIDEVASFVEILLKNPTDLLLKTLADMDNRNRNSETI